MLINDLNYLKRSSNYHNKFSGIDTPGKSNSSSRDFWEYPIQDFDYQFNSWGFRGEEYERYIGLPVNICLGDSFTVNVGGPIEHSWCSQLAENFDIPTLNLGMDGAGNDAIKLVYYRACEVFDVQNTFVMYSYLHRRLVDKQFEQVVVVNDTENFEHFLEHRISDVIECALPDWNWTNNERKFLKEQGIYYLDIPEVGLFSDHQSVDRKHIVKESYNNLRGPEWPTYKEFVNGAEPHADMFTKQFGQFLSYYLYTNRDGCHMNYDVNKEHANYLYTQWKLKNES